MSTSAIVAHAAERLVILGSADSAMVSKISAAIGKSGEACRCVPAGTLDAIYETLQREVRCVVMVDTRILGSSALQEVLLRLTEYSTVALVAEPARCQEVARWIARGDIEFIPRTGDFEPLAAAILLRRIRWAEQSEQLSGAPWQSLPADFGAMLRHEINNPLTGILGNAELLLTHYRDKLPVAATQRLETIVDLAVRLREATRRLGNAVEVEREAVR